MDRLICLVVRHNPHAVVRPLPFDVYYCCLLMVHFLWMDRLICLVDRHNPLAVICPLPFDVYYRCLLSLFPDASCSPPPFLSHPSLASPSTPSRLAVAFATTCHTPPPRPLFYGMLSPPPLLPSLAPLHRLSAATTAAFRLHHRHSRDLSAVISCLPSLLIRSRHHLSIIAVALFCCCIMSAINPISIAIVPIHWLSSQQQRG
jgi:hypothetical protein